MRTFKKLPVVTENENLPPRGRRHPDWIKVRIPSGENYFDVRDLVHGLELHTVCESASCPNIGECWDRRAITMRNLAYAAFAVIIFEPEAVLGASFQLSFAAVSALVAVSEGLA